MPRPAALAREGRGVQNPGPARGPRTAELERQRLAAIGRTLLTWGVPNPLAPEELEAVSERCMVLAAGITAAVLPDWDSLPRVRELLSASRTPAAGGLASIAARLRRVVAPALDLPHP